MLILLLGPICSARCVNNETKAPAVSRPNEFGCIREAIMYIYFIDLLFKVFLCIMFSVFVKCELNETNTVVCGLQDLIC